MNTTIVHRMIRTFTGYGSPDLGKDDIGPNKADWPFFNRVSHANTIQEHELLEAAERFHKYRNTQLPSILTDAGLIEQKGQVSSFLLSMKKQGETAKREYEQMAQRRAEKHIRESNGDTVLSKTLLSRKDVFDDMVIEAVMYARECDEATAKHYIKSYVSSWQPPRSVRVSVSLVDDVWKNKWGKESKTTRIALTYHYNPAFNAALKASLSFPQVKFSGATKQWTLANNDEVLNKAVKALEKEGAFFDETLALLRGENTFTPIVKTNRVTETTATLRGSSVILQWPYISEPDIRSRIMGEVKSTQGRKYNPDNKTWSVALTEAAPLIDRLRKLQLTQATALASAIELIPEVHTVMEERAKRIAISSASRLDDTLLVSEMRDELSKHFPEGRELYPFQYVGVQFAQLAGGRCLIGDDMGIGKTIQALAYIALNQDKLPALVVCPANVKYNWAKEAEAWLPNLSVNVVEGRSKGNIEPADIIVCNYDIMNGRMNQLLDMDINIVVCDESHYLKNSKAKRTEATLEVAKQSHSALCLSGTAITNRPNEFFTTLNLVRPNEFNSFFDYGKRYCDGYHTGWGWDFSGSTNSDELHERTRDFCIRRLKQEVLTELPDKQRTLHTVKPSKQALTNYNALHSSWIDEWNHHRETHTMPKGFVLNMLTDLRHECGKMKAASAVDYIKEYREITGKPLVVFAHHKDVLKEIHTGLKDDKDYQWRMGVVAGGVTAEARQQRVEAFQAGQLDVMLCSTVAAKEGITLTEADTVLFVEREWVPAWEEQAEDRVYRIGQDSDSVQAVYLTVAGTIDEKFNAVIEAKRGVVKAVLDGGEMDERKGIANALIEAMIDAGDLPADFNKKKGNQNK